jgi:hypothetical protein
LLLEDGTYGELAYLCDGSDTKSMSEQFCAIPMNEFWEAALDYASGDYVYAKVIAINERGASVASPVNTGGA